MSLAVNNASDEQGKFTTRYEALLRHYKMTGQKIQAGKANENGDVGAAALPVEARGGSVAAAARRPGLFRRWRNAKSSCVHWWCS